MLSVTVLSVITCCRCPRLAAHVRAVRAGKSARPCREDVGSSPSQESPGRRPAWPAPRPACPARAGRNVPELAPRLPCPAADRAVGLCRTVCSLGSARPPNAGNGGPHGPAKLTPGMFGNRSILMEAPRPAAVRRHPRAPWLAVGVVCFGAFMGQLDASIVTLTFRPMEHEFGAPLAGVQWVSLAYLLALVALLAPAGRIADAIGRKLVYGYGFVVFTDGSAACALAPGLGALVGCRLVQAVGAAMLQANSVALVTTSVPRRRMGLAVGGQ